jgi:hypothetical protein
MSATCTFELPYIGESSTLQRYPYNRGALGKNSRYRPHNAVINKHYCYWIKVHQITRTYMQVRESSLTI